MRHFILLAIAIFTAFPAAAAETENAALIELVGKPIRQELLDQMSAWRPILFVEGAAKDEVKEKFGKRFDAIESRVAGESHPGALARSRHEFSEILKDALKERYKQDHHPRFLNRGFGDYRAEKTGEAERTIAELKATRAASSRALAVADAAAVAAPAADTAAPGAGVFDGSIVTGAAAAEPPPAVAMPLLPLESRALAPNIASLTVPLRAAPVFPRHEPPPPPPSVEFYLDKASVRTDAEDYREVRRYLISQGAQAAVVDAAIAQALRKGVNPLIPLAVCLQESRCSATERNKKGEIVPVESAAGAIGAFQIMPDMHGATAEQLQNNALNVSKGIGLLIDLNKKFDDLGLMFAGYNAGAGAVQKAGGIPNYPETVDFVKKVAANVETLRQYVWDNLSASPQIVKN